MSSTSIDGTFYIAGHKVSLPIDTSHWSCQQQTDRKGRPRSKVRFGVWWLTFTTLTPEEDRTLTALAASDTTVVDAHAEFRRADGQGVCSTLWARQASVCHYSEHFDSTGTNGRAASLVRVIGLAATEMGMQAGTPGTFVMPAPRSYAYSGPPSPVAGPVVATSLEYTFKEFKATIWGADLVDAAVIKQLYTHFNAAKASSKPDPHWAAMEALIRSTTFPDPKTGEQKTLNGGWPPANGGFNKRLVHPTPPDKFDRYQKKVKVDENGLPILEGTFTSPIPEAGPFDYEARALEDQEKDYDLMYDIEVLKPLPFTGEEAEIIPWHGHAGNGTQTKMLFPPKDPSTGNYPWDWQKLQDEGYVKITYKSSPSGKFNVSPDGQTVNLRS